MHKILKMTGAYMWFYKKQTLVMLLGIILSAMLISGIGSLFYSGRMADLKHAREKYGDYHYSIALEEEMPGLGTALTVKKTVDEPAKLTFCTADDGYMKVMGISLSEGRYPETADEIALDHHTINNLGISDEIGAKVVIGEDEFVLCGIMAEGPDSDEMKVYVSEDAEFEARKYIYYLKFDESTSLSRQLNECAAEYGLDARRFKENTEVTEYLNGSDRESLVDIAEAAFTNSDAGLVYFIGKVNQNYRLIEKAVFLALCIFGAFIVYSLFEVTALRRRSEYALLQVIGLEEKHLFLIMLSELMLVAVVGYPIGCILGNAVAKLIYSDVANIFSGNSEGAEFYISGRTAGYGAVLFLCFIMLITFKMIRKMRRFSDIEMMKQSVSDRTFVRKIYSEKNRDLTRVMTGRFMFGNIGTFIGMTIALSLGGIIFLSTAYTADSTVKNYNHKKQTDEGLGTDISIFIDTVDAEYVIPESAADRIKTVQGILSADEMTFLPGTVPMEHGEFKWTEFYGSDRREIVTKLGEDSYRVKANVYGYSDKMTESLGDYLIEGSIDPNLLKSENSVILKTLTDGQGNTDGIAIGVGDTITVEAEDKTGNPVTKEFIVAAVVNRPIAKNTSYIGDNGSDTVDVIMTNSQMAENFGVSGYNSISVDVEDNADQQKVVREIKSELEGINHCTIKDNTEDIKSINDEIHRKERFFYGIAVILICISLLYIINSMRFIIFSRRREFGIIRAMGMTDSRFLRMLILEGVCYGLYASLFMTVIYLFVHRILEYVMKKVFLYIIVEGNIMLRECLIFSAVNIALCIFAVMLAGRDILKEEIMRLGDGGL